LGGGTRTALQSIEETTVSYAKFAPITASLLARKGEAAPSFGIKRPVPWTSELPAVREPVRDIPASFATGTEFAHVENVPAQQSAVVPQPAVAHEKPRRVVVSMSPCEFERLGIAAVKKGVSRHDLVRDTVNAYLARLAIEMNRCACLDDGTQCATVCAKD
jgi:hypothetical protein